MKRKKKKAGILPLLALAAVLFTACAADDADTDRQNPKQNPDTAGLTAFVMEDSTDSPATRLVGEHTGSGVRFYWSRYDCIFVDNPTENDEWRADKKNNIYDLISNQGTGDGKISKAKFWFEGEFTKPEYRVRFLGRDHDRYRYFDKIQIENDENYIGPEILRKDYMQTGDFATGIAHRQADGTYTFKLEHKASYITFRPSSTQKAFTKWGGACIKDIEISADQALCGWFDIKGDTIDLSSRPTDKPHKKVTCANNKNVFLRIPSEEPPLHLEDPSYAIMVVPPGTYTNFTVRYRFGPNFNFSTGCVTKTYPRVTFTAGKNKVISQKIQVEEYPGDTYYMWDAAEPYWKGHEWNSSDPAQPIGGFATDHYPKSNTDTRWYNEIPSYAGADGAAPAVAASRSCKDCPNINELIWYFVYGAPYVDYEVYALMDEIWCGRVWLKKLSTIAREQGKTVAELKEKAPDGVDYTRSTKKPDMDSFHIASGELGHGKPNNMTDYFSLPFLGGYGPTENDFRPSHPKRWMFGNTPGAAFYWSSTPTPGSPDEAYVWEVDLSRDYDKFDIRPMNRQYGISRMWPADR
ncbi:putative lipoprotein [Prevotella denticola CRIS 18C-A]|uniref:Putative lipoprotein n=1 Tax=Prevotella denticola CRIS 18C-A TaxID=944557 RepID=F0H9C8_9BACT|nr:hypothetical protein [Prevotella denticola]EGC85563.1 putative lipoprotein [Prevotella denticola CRIS 18C-A]